MGVQIGLADTGRLTATLRAAIAMERGALDTLPGSAEDLFAFARAQPGHLYEATAAFVLAMSGREREAAAELDRFLHRALAASGPRWLAAMAELAMVAVVCHDTAAARAVYQAMLSYRGRLVVRAGANASLGPVSRYLGLLALELGTLDDAVALLEEAAALEEGAGALPGLASTLVLLASARERRGGPGDAARAAADRHRAATIAGRLELTLLASRFTSRVDEWALRRDGADWVLEAADEHVRLRDSRGLHYLRSLLAAPGQEIAALDLVAGGSGLAAAPADPVLDLQARAAYRRRLAELEAALDAADRAGDRERAEQAEAEREALMGQLRRATGLSGRPRAHSADAERARVNVTRTLRATLERILLGAPRAGAHLQRSVHTGQSCRYQPEPGGPARWQV
jgi:tetratricopeptide (TPR) repeat protein